MYNSKTNPGPASTATPNPNNPQTLIGVDFTYRPIKGGFRCIQTREKVKNAKKHKYRMYKIAQNAEIQAGMRQHPLGAPLPRQKVTITGYNWNCPVCNNSNYGGDILSQKKCNCRYCGQKCLVTKTQQKRVVSQYDTLESGWLDG